MIKTTAELLDDIQAETGIDNERLRVLMMDFLDEMRGPTERYAVAEYIRRRVKEDG